MLPLDRDFTATDTGGLPAGTINRLQDDDIFAKHGDLTILVPTQVMPQGSAFSTLTDPWNPDDVDFALEGDAGFPGTGHRAWFHLNHPVGTIIRSLSVWAQRTGAPTIISARLVTKDVRIALGVVRGDAITVTVDGTPEELIVPGTGTLAIPYTMVDNLALAVEMDASVSLTGARIFGARYVIRKT